MLYQQASSAGNIRTSNHRTSLYRINQHIIDPALIWKTLCPPKGDTRPSGLKKNKKIDFIFRCVQLLKDKLTFYRSQNLNNPWVIMSGSVNCWLIWKQGVKYVLRTSFRGALEAWVKKKINAKIHSSFTGTVDTEPHLVLPQTPSVYTPQFSS